MAASRCSGSNTARTWSGCSPSSLPPANAPDRKAGNPGGHRGFTRWQAALCVRQSLQSPARTRRQRWPVVADLGRGRRAVRCGAGRQQSLREQLGRAPARTRQSLTGPAGRGTIVRVDPVRHIASEGSVSVIDLTAGGTDRRAANRNPHRPARLGAGARRRMAAGSSSPTPAATRSACIDTRTDRDRRNHLDAAKSGGLVRRAAQRAGV